MSLAELAAIAAAAAPEPKICEKGGSGLFLPLFGDSENESSKIVRALIYVFFLLYFFYGASLVSDYFMNGISQITSKKRLVKCKRTDRMVTVLVWNSTVANLTLMALGSSAPEILLSIIETLQQEFYSGNLGPSTIVGSAAFNLFSIMAVCIMAIPAGQVRRIKELQVFHITAVFSVFAYVWLLLIVVVITPDVIDIGESLLTILFFPGLVVLCFLADRGYFKRKEMVAHGVNREVCTIVKACQNVYDIHTIPPRMRSVVVHEAALEHKAAIHHEWKCQKGGNMSTGRGSTVVEEEPRKSIALPAGEPNPAGDDGDVISDLYGDEIFNDFGVVTFCRDIQNVVASAQDDTKALVYVLRRNGTRGLVTCRYHCEHMAAIPGYDYREAVGEVRFDDGVSMATIELTILPVRPLENNESFQLVLNQIEGGAIFNPNDDGGENSGVLTICIKNEAKTGTPTLLQRCVNQDAMSFGWDIWKEQVQEALQVERMADDEDEDPKPFDYLVHGIVVPWKLLYAATTPPPLWCGGWLLFFVALFHIGILTALVCDLASLFGCVLGIEDLVTAIVVVAPGTSLPDLFASKSSAQGDEDADASIVNVTGSNSVNVFLGIGIPWTMSSVYWAVEGTPLKWELKYPNVAKDYPDGGKFVVLGGALSFSVLVFASGSVIALCLLRFRRTMYDGELGGPQNVQYGSAGLLVFLYFTYVGLSIWKSSSDSADVFQWICIAIAVLVTLAEVAVEFALKSGKLTAWKAPESPNEGENSPLKEVADSPMPALILADGINPEMVGKSPGIDGLIEELEGEATGSPEAKKKKKLIRSSQGPDEEPRKSLKAKKMVKRVSNAKKIDGLQPSATGQPDGEDGLPASPNARKTKVQLKAVMLGDSGVGKTALMNQYVWKKFDKQALAESNYMTKEDKVNEIPFSMQIWDSAGENKTTAYDGADCVMLMYDITVAKSFESLDDLRKDFLAQAKLQDPDSFPFIVIGNKCDLKDEVKVSAGTVQEWCKSLNQIPFLETSAAQPVNVEAAFQAIAGAAMKRKALTAPDQA